jgi:hypothetical protein
MNTFLVTPEDLSEKTFLQEEAQRKINLLKLFSLVTIAIAIMCCVTSLITLSLSNTPVN